MQTFDNFIKSFKVSSEYKLRGSSKNPEANYINDIDFENIVIDLGLFPKKLKESLKGLSKNYYFSDFKLGYKSPKLRDELEKLKNTPVNKMTKKQIKIYQELKKNAFNHFSINEILNLSDAKIIELLKETGIAKLDVIAYFEPLNKYVEFTIVYLLKDLDLNKKDFIEDIKKEIKYNYQEKKYWKVLKNMRVYNGLKGNKSKHDKIYKILQSKLGRINSILDSLLIFDDPKNEFKQFINKPLSNEDKNNLMDQMNSIVFEISRIDPDLGDPYKLMNVIASKSVEEFIEKMKRILNENAKKILENLK